MTSDIKTKRLREILARIKPLKTLSEASIRHARLDRLLKSVLPSLLADYCQVKAYSSRELAIEAFSQAVATHLRFSSPKLIEKLRKHDEFSDLNTITVRVGTLPQNEAVNTRKPRPNAVSDINCELLRTTAASMTSPELRTSLERLASTLAKKKKEKPSL